MTYQTLFMMATAGFTLMATFFLLDARQKQRAVDGHVRAKLRHQVDLAHSKAVRMVRRHGQTFAHRVLTLSYIDRMEAAHHALDLPPTDRFDRLRQELIRRNRGVEVVV